ncbi:MAG: pantoate--beta-alanine ligase [Alphaproteobacteria bacterium]|nr:pantoate--beta-alanine ligase [Alphaproteobacteria bacterium]MDE1968348.1 pantoate--beta-alanine ligase [Alphaproteobacteria bacterium]
MRDLAVAPTVAELRRNVAAWRDGGATVALVPTMGALHAGHLALVSRAKALAQRVVASIFVNPTQFGANEDLSRYPRDIDGDRRKLAAAGCDLAFVPSVAEMYPEGAVARVDPGPLATVLEGQFRPGHFAGVATIVAKLLLQAAPDVAVFGEKDFQQLLVIRRVVRDLDIPVRIDGVPTVRENDGLALSSRNAYLSPDERARAPLLHRTLRDVARGFADGDPAAPERGIEALLAGGFAKVDYLDVRDAETLDPPHPGRPTRVLAAAWLGRTRLIDNVALAP